MKKLLAFASALALTVSQANAATIPITAGSGTNIFAIQDGSSNYYPAHVLFGLSATNQVDVNSSHQLLVTGPVTEVDGGSVTLGAKADPKSAATDNTAITLMQVDKEISFQIQAIAAAQIADPCGGTKTNANFSSGTSGGAIVAAVSAKKIYICQIAIVTSAAANVSLIEGTGSSVCTGGPAAVWLNTGSTAGNGASFPANGGISAGNGGATVAQTASTNTNLCVLFSTGSTPNVVVSISFVQQ